MKHSSDGHARMWSYRTNFMRSVWYFVLAKGLSGLEIIKNAFTLTPCPILASPHSVFMVQKGQFLNHRFHIYTYEPTWAIQWLM